MINKWFGILSNHGHKMYKRLRSNILPTYRDVRKVVSILPSFAPLYSLVSCTYTYTFYIAFLICVPSVTVKRTF